MRSWQGRAHLCAWQQWSGPGWTPWGRVLTALQLPAHMQMRQVFHLKQVKKDVLLPLPQIQKVLIDIPRSQEGEDRGGNLRHGYALIFTLHEG